MATIKPLFFWLELSVQFCTLPARGTMDEDSVRYDQSRQTQLKTNFEVDRKFDAFYTGGTIQITSNGEFMFCGCGNKITVVDISSGKVTSSLGQQQAEDITRFCLSPDDEYVILATRQLLLRQWDWRNNKLVRSWKALHNAAITSMAFDPTATLLATGSADSSIKLWDIRKECCTHNIKGHQGVISIVKFHPDVDKMWLFSAGDDYKLRVWDLNTSTCIGEIGVHVSSITCICFSEDGNTMYSSSRDSTVAMMDVNKLQVIKTVPVFEVIESLILLPLKHHIQGLEREDPESPYILTMGSKGLIKVWDMKKAKCLMVKQNSLDKDENGIVDAVHIPSNNTLTVATFDHYITQINMDDFSTIKQFCGYADEVLDVQFLGDNDSHIIIATNSEYIKVYDVATWNCQVLQGHTDIVLSLCVHKNKELIATSSKDNDVRVWKFSRETGQVKCVAVGKGHTQAVGTVTFSCLNTSTLVSGGMDTTVKVWEVPGNLDTGTIISLKSSFTEKAHSKDINSLAVSPNDKYIATGSQDKTAKLWNLKTLARIGVMKGHRRGIWCVQFSPVDQCLVTSSADGTVKIWSVTNFSNVKTFQGHTSSVLRVTFLSRGMQLLSCGSDGLMKLWTVKTNECVKTFDKHENKVWALAVNSKEDTVITGGADSTIILWKDMSVADSLQKTAEWENQIIQEQKLSNLIQQKKYLKAIGLAITLEQPFKLLKIMKEIMSQSQGSEHLRSTLARLRLDQIDKVLQFSSQWNTNSRHCHEAQVVLSSILQTFQLEELKKFPKIRDTLEALLPYTDRHFQRMNRLLQQAQFVEYTWQCMRTASDDLSQSSTLDVTPEFFPASSWKVDRNAEVMTVDQDVDDSMSEKNMDTENSSNHEQSDDNTELDISMDKSSVSTRNSKQESEDSRQRGRNKRKKILSDEKDTEVEIRTGVKQTDSSRNLKQTSSKKHKSLSKTDNVVKKNVTSKNEGSRRQRQRKKTNKERG